MYCIVIFALVLSRFEFSFEFAECPNSYEFGPYVPGINSCLEWAAYLQSIQTNVTAWCMDPLVAQRCCFTCGVVYANFSQCLDSSPDCQTLYESSGRNCSSENENGTAIVFYCPSTCGLCNPLEGPSCSNLSSSVCGSYGYCSDVTWFNVSTISCVCYSNHVGPSCSRENKCITNNTCSNNSICVISQDENVDYTCVYDSTNSTNDTNLRCDSGSFTCRNGGTCSPEGSCQCRNYFSGPYCETFIAGCISSSCQNGGTCLSNGFCYCQPLYMGMLCEQMIGGCYLTPCKNGGICLNNGLCQCTSNYNGVTCENVNPVVVTVYSGCDIGLIVGISVESFVIVVLLIALVFCCIRYRLRAKKIKLQENNRVDDHLSNSAIRLKRKVVEEPESNYIYFEDQNGQKYCVNPSKKNSEILLNQQSLNLKLDNTKSYYYEDDVGKFVIKRKESDASPKDYYTIEMKE